jgi:hypothetical protein
MQQPSTSIRVPTAKHSYQIYQPSPAPFPSLRNSTHEQQHPQQQQYQSPQQQQQEQENINVERHLIFQCRNCRALVGDSVSYACGNEEFGIIGVQSPSSVSITGVEPQLSSDRFDCGSVFYKFVCDQCQCHLGRYYKTTNSYMDDYRELWCFFRDTITCYELGGATADIDPFTILPTCTVLDNESIPFLQTSCIAHDERLEPHKNLINKILTLNQTLNSLEKKMKHVLAVQEDMKVTYNTMNKSS